MQHGRVVESGLTDQILEDPQHPYTQRLVASALRRYVMTIILDVQGLYKTFELHDRGAQMAAIVDLSSSSSQGWHCRPTGPIWCW